LRALSEKIQGFYTVHEFDMGLIVRLTDRGNEYRLAQHFTLIVPSAP